MKTVQIPECMNPFEVIVNNNRYSYPAGTEQTVPKEVAEVIEVHMKNHEERTAPPYVPESGGGGATCKLKLVVRNSEEMGFYVYGEAYIPGYENINLESVPGTTEYEIPCGSVVAVNASNSYISSKKNVTIASESEPFFVARVTEEAGGESMICIEAYC